MTHEYIVSRHYLRRRARDKANKLRALDSPHGEPNITYHVRRAFRGPYRWFVYAEHN
jgi:hypothetical protein